MPKRPAEYGEYMDLFNGMVDSILMCKKPVICRANGMRVAGGQEIGLACDLTISSDTAIYGQAGPRHGSAPDGGSSDFLPWYLSMEDAMWNCVSCEMWSAYKMKAKNLISKVVPVLKQGDKWVRNPQIITETYVQDGAIVLRRIQDRRSSQRGQGTLEDSDHGFRASGQGTEQHHLDVRESDSRAA